MWDGAQLRYRLAEGRSSQVDWLPDGVPAARVALTLTAMANAQGGWLILGVEPGSNRIVGLHDTRESDELVQQAAESVDPPLILPHVHTLDVGGCALLVVQVPSGLPHLYALGGRFFVRDGALNAPLAAPRLRRLLLERVDPGAEGICPEGASLEDLDLRAGGNYMAALGLPRGADPLQGLRRRGCLREMGGRPAPTLAGLLLFGIDPQRWAPQAEVRLTRHAGRTPGGQAPGQSIQGRLGDQIRHAAGALMEMIGDVSPDWGWPAPAVQGVVANAVIHRDYGAREEPIRIDVFSDRFEVHSPGGFPGPVTPETLTARRFRRNPVVAQVLEDLGVQGAPGWSVEALSDWAGHSGARAPVIEEVGGGVRVTLYAGEQRTTAESTIARRVGESQPGPLITGQQAFSEGGWNSRPRRRTNADG